MRLPERIWERFIVFTSTGFGVRSGHNRFLFRNEDVNRRRGPHLYFSTILPPTKIFFLGRRNIVNFPEYTKPAVWGAIAGAVAMVIVGFSSMGWTTAATAQRLAKQSADEAVVAALVPV